MKKFILAVAATLLLVGSASACPRKHFLSRHVASLAKKAAKAAKAVGKTVVSAVLQGAVGAV